MIRHKPLVAAIVALAGLFAAHAQPASADKGKAMTFHGTVEAVTFYGLTVKGEKVDGWMEAMTMNYLVDKAETLKRIKAGDTITATVYKGDLTLHDVQIVPSPKSSGQKSK